MWMISFAQLQIKVFLKNSYCIWEVCLISSLWEFQHLFHCQSQHNFLGSNWSEGKGLVLCKSIRANWWRSSSKLCDHYKDFRSKPHRVPVDPGFKFSEQDVLIDNGKISNADKEMQKAYCSIVGVTIFLVTTEGYQLNDRGLVECKVRVIRHPFLI